MLCARRIPSRGDGLSVARRPAFPRHAPRRRGYFANVHDTASFPHRFFQSTAASRAISRRQSPMPPIFLAYCCRVSSSTF